ncbi:Bug family tripartite tricarboxylate transporter substrate binding protein [Sediminicoccus rosea]|uniref:Tripartite tricarboxylate transporter substrate binding protein n=1 Tax=Sediminicoccus rosea TaxID=1225128 RepID=A0ABZ0PMX8_9PROT|nr:tripartite tricarboxylate transporter substrate binding protein [Sediminicoccus rosea]WPB87069.1 tripartite tricarboxylate transporter substrate binding protein [Sediminicoccus rosea]
MKRRALLLTPLATPALAQGEWRPDRPLRIIVPFPAGGSADVQSRLIAEPLSQALGQPVVIENRPGAGGTIGATEAARTAPDGLTLFMATTGTHSANPWLYPRLAYDPVADFAPVTLVSDYAQCIAIGPDWPAPPARNFAGLIAGLRAEPARSLFGSSGNGSPTHLAGEMFAHAMGLRLEHVPYRGQAPALNDLIGGRLSLMFPSISDVLGQLRGGRVAAVATMARARHSAIPDVPTTAELGHPDLVSSIWSGLYTRAGSPPAAIARLNLEIVRILNAPATRQRLGDAGFELLPGTPEQLARFQAAETARWGEVIRRAGIRAD